MKFLPASQENLDIDLFISVLQTSRGPVIGDAAPFGARREERGRRRNDPHSHFSNKIRSRWHACFLLPIQIREEKEEVQSNNNSKHFFFCFPLNWEKRKRKWNYGDVGEDQKEKGALFEEFGLRNLEREREREREVYQRGVGVVLNEMIFVFYF